MKGASHLQVLFRLGLLLFAGQLACSLARGVEAAETQPSSSPASNHQDLQETPAEAPVSLGELPDVVARLEIVRADVLKATAPDGAAQAVLGDLDAAYRKALEVRQRMGGLEYDRLLEVSRDAVATQRAIAEAGKTVESTLGRIEDASRRVGALETRFDALAQRAEQVAAPAEIVKRTARCRSELDQLSAQLEKKQGEVLLLLDRVAEVRGVYAALTVETESSVAESRRRFSKLAEEPLWRLGGSSHAWRATEGRLVQEAGRFVEWAKTQAGRLTALSVTFFFGTILLLRRLASRRRRAADEEPQGESPWIHLVPLATGVLVTVLAIAVLSPQAPLIVYQVLWIPAAPAAARIVLTAFGAGNRLLVWTLAFSLMLTPLSAVTTAIPLVNRLILILQTAPLAGALGLELRRRAPWIPVERGRAGGGFQALAGIIMMLSLLGAVAGSLAGWVGFAGILGNGALWTLGGFFLIRAGELVLTGLLERGLESRSAEQVRILREHRALVAQTFKKAIRLAANAAALIVSAQAFGFDTALLKASLAFFRTEWVLGSISISPGAVAAFLLTAGIALPVSRLVEFLLLEEVLPRFGVRRGTAEALSATTRNVVLSLGFVLAAAVAGIDLTKFGFLAGALGVGIGFGLQNIVSNFVSGLILLFERPIQVGDTVDVAGTTGSVTGIGIRASTVRTFDGSEVVVPNADLISKPVTNWTRKDPFRRYEVTVGVAYGSSLENTARALLAAAARTRGVLATPAPEALFLAFGESSLDWTLRAWLKIEEGARVLSDLKQAVSEELGRAGLEVPFPQRDLHVRFAGEDGSHPSGEPHPSR